MDRTSVESSSLNSIGYDDASQTLEVEFKNGFVYQYFDVPPSVYLELAGASSIGQYFNSSIRNAYRYAQI